MISSPFDEILLPAGLWVDGTRHQRAALRAVTGADEELLIERGRTRPSARWTTALLSRCLQGIGTLQVDEEVVRALTVGDREALLLHVRRLTFGEQLDCNLTCPHEECRETLDFQVAVQQLLLPPYDAAANVHETTIHAGETAYRVRFRLPTGGDQEAVAEGLGQRKGQAGALFLARCVESVETDAGACPDAELPPAAADALGRLMCELDPQAELKFQLDCPACGRRCETALNAATLLLQELAGRSADLYRQVHTLALHYHWSESAVLAMTAPKRQLYIDLLTEEYGAAAAVR